MPDSTTLSRRDYTLIGSSLSLGLVGGWFIRSLWTSKLRRVSSVDLLTKLSTTPASKPTRLRGTVTRVGDADNFHLFHQPFWYRKPIPDKGRDIKALGTVHVRLAGVDAPEVSHLVVGDAVRGLT